MEDGYYLSTYMHIDPEAHLHKLTYRHDQGMALFWKKSDKVELIQYWEFERISGLKKHDLSFYSRKHAYKVINALLEPLGLSLKDLNAIWGTPGLKVPGQFSSYNLKNECPLHTLCHLFSGMLVDSNVFYNDKMLALALDGGPDDIIDIKAREKQFYWGVYVNHGQLSFFPIPSPGIFWGFAHILTGMEEGSLMALGSAVTSFLSDGEKLAYGAPRIFNKTDLVNAYRWVKKIIKKAKSLKAGEIPLYDSRFSLIENQIGIAVKVIQRASLIVLDDIVKQAIARYSLTPSELVLSISGGFALNCPTNSNIMRKYNFKAFQTCPCVSDCGIALGLGLYEFYAQLNVFQFRLKNAYYGTKDNRRINELKEYSQYIESIVPFDKTQFVTDIIKGPLIWFDRGAEIGPRALGARSILGDPRRIETKDKLNKIKKRQWWRPVSPIVLDEEQKYWFNESFYSPYMLCTSQVKSDKAGLIKAALHLDQSARIQSLRKENNPLLYKAILAFYKATGIPLICNTSLNDKGEPIIEKLEQCINFALRKGISIIYCNGERIVLKNSSNYSLSMPLPRNFLLFAPLGDKEVNIKDKHNP